MVQPIVQINLERRNIVGAYDGFIIAFVPVVSFLFRVYQGPGLQNPFNKILVLSKADVLPGKRMGVIQFSLHRIGICYFYFGK